MYDLVVIGNPSFDHIVSQGTDMSRTLSGSAAYSIVTATKTGLESIAVIGALGSDFVMRFREALGALGVPEHFTLESKTTLGFEVETHSDGESLLRRCIDVGGRIGVGSIPDEFLAARAILLSPMLREIDDEFIQWICNSSDASVWLDPSMLTADSGGTVKPISNFEGFEKTQCILDYIQMNEHEAAMFTGESDPLVAAELLVDMVAEHCILTLGADGALLYDGEGFTTISAYATTPVDTYCAGSVHFAGYLTSILAEQTESSALATATALASIRIEKPGLDFDFNPSEVSHRVLSVEETITHR
ncbi:MAG: carbohydrate kinase family protein [Candidatus Thorarchaeota archaeon]|nr:MAG: hypothetical protein DRP09_02360 [Candidatus Thorarchaeota archaeon]